MVKKVITNLKKYQKEYNKKYRLINKDKIKNQKKEYYEANKEEINKIKREKRAIENSKKKIEKYKTCTNCKKKLKKNEKNFRYKSKKKNILTFRPVCRECERKILSMYNKSKEGKKSKSTRDKRYAITGKKKIAQKKYYDKNQPAIMKKSVARRAEQRKTNPQILIRDRLAGRIRQALKKQNIVKSKATKDLTGCSISFLKEYLEKKFKPGMTWKNYGVKGWHIDHIIPCSRFDLTNLDQQKICFNYKNLQPLWALENLLKSNK